jgi:F-type H+-transporting ATPase subunit epsilon
MESKLVQLHVVSAQGQLFLGEVKSIRISATEGEMGINSGHAPLLTSIKPGMLNLTLADNSEELMYVSGGILEVQPDEISVLADTVVRAEELDQQAALKLQAEAQAKLQHRGQDFDYARAINELAQASAQLQMLQKIKKLKSLR